MVSNCERMEGHEVEEFSIAGFVEKSHSLLVMGYVTPRDLIGKCGLGGIIEIPDVLEDRVVKTIFDQPLSDEEKLALKRELPIFGGVPKFLIDRILSCFPYQPSYPNLDPTFLRREREMNGTFEEEQWMDVGEYPLTPNDLEPGEFVSFLVSAPFEGKGYGTRFSGPPQMGLTAMRGIDLYNHLVGLGFLKGKKHKYGVYAPDFDDKDFITRLVNTMTCLEKGPNSNPTLSVLLSNPSQGSLRRAYEIEAAIMRDYPQAMIIRGGTNTGQLIASKEAVMRSETSANVLLAGGNPEYAIWQLMERAREVRFEDNCVADVRAADWAVRSLLTNGARANFPFKGTVAHKERLGSISIMDISPKLKVPDPIDIGLNQPIGVSHRHDAFRNPETGKNVPTLFLAMGGNCAGGPCYFCSVLRGENKLRPIDEIMKDVDQFFTRVCADEDLDNPGDHFGIWIETPTATKYPSKKVLNLARDNGIVGSDLFNYDKMYKVLSPYEEDNIGVHRFLNFLTILEVIRRSREKYGDKVQSGIETRPDEVIGKGSEKEIKMGENMLMALARSGVNYISFSGETGDEGLKLLNKGYKFEQYVALVDLVISMVDKPVEGMMGKDGRQLNFKEVMQIGNSFMCMIPDIRRIREMQIKGFSPEEVLRVLTEEGKERKLEFYKNVRVGAEKRPFSEKEIDSYMEKEAYLFVDTIFDMERIVKQLEKMVKAGLMVSFGANVLTPFAPDNLKDLSANAQIDTTVTAFWGAYLWLRGIDPSEALVSSPYIGASWVKYFESRGDHGFFELLPDSVRDKLFTAIIDTISRVFPGGAVAKQEVPVVNNQGVIEKEVHLFMSNGQVEIQRKKADTGDNKDLVRSLMEAFGVDSIEELRRIIDEEAQTDRSLNKQAC